MSSLIDKVQQMLMRGDLDLPHLLSMRQELSAPFRLHPLGFLACTLLTEGTRKVRFHVWPWGLGFQQSSNHQIHDHFFEFRSWVISGSVENVEYQATHDGEELSVYRTEYEGDYSTLTRTNKTFKISELRRSRYSAGSSYEVAAGVFHKTTRVSSEPAVTVLITNDVSSAAPLVLGPNTGLDRYIFRRELVDEAAVEKFISGQNIDLNGMFRF